MRHRGIHMTGELDESRLEAVLLRLPRQIERIDWDTVAAEAGPWVERHEAERLRLRRINDLPDVDPQLVAHQRDLIDEPDVHRPKCVLEELHHLGDAW